jgi:hypothetical protein
LGSEGRKNVYVNADEIKSFARTHWDQNPTARWNGRQIRNAFRTAVAMAEFQAREKGLGADYGMDRDVRITIGSEQFKKIAKMATEFDEYMTETMGHTYEFKANKTGMRRREREAEKERQERAERERGERAEREKEEEMRKKIKQELRKEMATRSRDPPKTKENNFRGTKLREDNRTKSDHSGAETPRGAASNTSQSGDSSDTDHSDG